MSPITESTLDRAFAIGFAMENEKGLVDHPNDPGGITNFGVSLRYAKAQGAILSEGGKILLDFDLDNDGDIDADDIRAMTEDQGRLVYEDIWRRFRFGEVEHRQVAAKFFDLSLPMGYGGASRCVQRALRSCRFEVAEDGYVGPISRLNLNAAADWNADAILSAICSESAGYFRSLEAPDFEAGWLNRAYTWP